MASKHARSLSQPERALWREVFARVTEQLVARRGSSRSPTKTIELATLYADLAVRAYRETVLWRTE